LSAGELARLFQAFEQADNSATRHFGGTGLGLAITRELARLMGGEAGASSAGMGQGACFWFTAMLGRQTASPSANPAVPEAEGGASGERSESGPQAVLRHHFADCRLLLVEDEPMNREVALELLQDGPNLQVDVAMDGAEALRMAVETPYSLILMDVQMPVMDGLTATRALRQLPGYARTPILAMTANAFSEDRQRCLDAGMNDHLGKPVEPEALYRMLIKWLSLAE
jgi:CheY-like chemotaxis protein